MQVPADGLGDLFGAALDRRRFLKGSAGGLFLLGLGSVTPLGCRSYPKPPGPLQYLNAREYAVVNAVARRLLEPPDLTGPGRDGIDVAAHVDALVVDWDTEARGQLRIMLRVFEHGTYLFDLQAKRFTKLSPRAQDRYLSGWMTSTLGARRIAFRALKALVAAGFYQDPRSWPAIGYDGPWRGRVEAAARVSPEAVTPLGALVSKRR